MICSSRHRNVHATSHDQHVSTSRAHFGPAQRCSCKTQTPATSSSESAAIRSNEANGPRTVDDVSGSRHETARKGLDDALLLDIRKGRVQLCSCCCKSRKMEAGLKCCSPRVPCTCATFQGVRATVSHDSSVLNKSITETALPGGRVDETDASIDSAALREAEEEVGLNASTSPMLFLTALPPVPSRNLLCVFPCVYFLASNDPPATLGTLKPNPDEVENIFQAPLDTFVSGNTTQHSFRDVDGFMGTVYRLHSFDDPSFYSPVTGMTAEVLIRVAMAAFDVQELPFALIGPRGKPSGELATKLAEQHRAETESMKQPGRSKV